MLRDREFESDQNTSRPASSSRHQNINMGGLFYDSENNVPLRFYIQKHLNESLILSLSTLIIANGGSIIDKVPFRGFVLIDPSSPKGQNLVTKWSDSEKPDRHIVSYTYVNTSVAENSLLEPLEFKNAMPLFIHDDKPVTFALEEHLDDALQENLTRNILKSGGRIAQPREKPRVIIVDPATSYHRSLVREYEHDSETYVESPSWVGECIEQDLYEHVLESRIVGGRKPGSSRTAYTAEDDENLVEYMGRRLPYRHMTGRTGNEIFKELCERVDLYPWASRHTWHSWRNRYKTRRERLDAEIDVWVKENPPVADGKGQYLVKRNKLADRIEHRHLDAHEDDDPPHPPLPIKRKSTSEMGDRSMVGGQSPNSGQGNIDGNGVGIKRARRKSDLVDENMTAEELMMMHVGHPGS